MKIKAKTAETFRVGGGHVSDVLEAIAARKSYIIPDATITRIEAVLVVRCVEEVTDLNYRQQVVGWDITIETMATIYSPSNPKPQGIYTYPDGVTDTANAASREDGG